MNIEAILKNDEQILEELKEFNEIANTPRQPLNQELKSCLKQSIFETIVLESTQLTIRSLSKFLSRLIKTIGIKGIRDEINELDSKFAAWIRNNNISIFSNSLFVIERTMSLTRVIKATLNAICY